MISLSPYQGLEPSLVPYGIVIRAGWLDPERESYKGGSLMKTRSISLALALLAGPQIWAQGERGGFNGVVTDASGSVVPSAVVKATEVTTNVDTQAITTDGGIYRLPYMPSGTYRITVSKAGFQTAVRENVILHVAQPLTVDFALQLGAVTEQVTVSGEAQLLQSS